MDLFWIIVFSIFAALAIVQAILACVQTHEHCRFARSRVRERGCCDPAGHALVLIPVRGGDIELEDNLQRLFLQDYPDYTIRFIVESHDDPAFPIIRRLMAAHPDVCTECVIAGPAMTEGQKVHNLLVATEAIPKSVRYLVFVDGDARPNIDWLRTLVGRTTQPGVGATTGYRWLIPERSTWANLVCYSINCNYATLFGRGRQAPNFVWGGSWAIHRDVFDSIGIHNAWRGTLCDDMVVSRVIQRAGLRIEFEPTCVLKSPADGTTGQVLAFLRRQYQLTRFDALPAWFAALGFGLFGAISFWGSVALALAAWSTGIYPFAPASLLLFLYGSHVYRGVMRQRLPRLYFPEVRSGNLRKAATFDILCAPVASLVNALVLLASGWGRQVRWRGITYIVGSKGIRVLRRREATATVQTPRVLKPVKSLTSPSLKIERGELTRSDAPAARMKQLVDDEVILNAPICVAGSEQPDHLVSVDSSQPDQRH